jgi:hypothetical protein
LAGGVAQLVEALISNPSIIKKKKRKEKINTSTLVDYEDYTCMLEYLK